MKTSPDVASLAALLTDPSRAAILMHLCDGRSWTAAELAKVAGIQAPAASAHLRKLLDGSLIRMTPSGRHRYFRLADNKVAQMLELFMRFSPEPPALTPGDRRAAANLRRCRLCYNHLAGQIGVAITQRMVELLWLVEAEPWYNLTPEGQRALSGIGVESSEGRTCMDWSERKLHIAGSLGTQVAHAFLSKKWLTRDNKSRALLVTALGAESLSKLLDCTNPELIGA